MNTGCKKKFFQFKIFFLCHSKADGHHSPPLNIYYTRPVVSVVPIDLLAPDGTKPSASTVMNSHKVIYFILASFLDHFFFQKYFVDQMALLEMTIYFRIHSILRVNIYPPSATHMHHWTGTSLDWIMASRLFGTKPLSKPMMTSQSHTKEQSSIDKLSK